MEDTAEITITNTETSTNGHKPDLTKQKERSEKPVRIMDTTNEKTTLDTETKEHLEKFEDMMSKFAEKAKERGHDIGIDYFKNYKPKLIDRVIAAGGLAGFAVAISLVDQYFKINKPRDPQTGEEIELSPLYVPDGTDGSELLKVRTMDNTELSEEEKEFVRKFGKLENDPRIIGKLGKFLRKLSLDEIPQAAAISWKLMNVFGIHSARRMESRARARKKIAPDSEETTSLEDQYPEAFQLYVDANKEKVKKGIFGGYTAVARGKNEEAQFLADAILLKYMCPEAEPWILHESVKNVALRRGAK